MLVIGAHGFLGGHVARVAAGDFVIIEGNRITTDSLNGVAIDITKQHSVKAAFETAQPDVVMLLSAISDIDRCEQHPEQAREVNLRGAENVVEACARGGARLMFTSTGAVFDGRRHGYREESPVSPVSVYGETKALAERSVLKLGTRAIVVRMSLVLGCASRPGTNSLIESLKTRWAAGQDVMLPAFEQRNPIDAVTASRLMVELLRIEASSGIFHVGSKDSMTRYDLGVRLALRLGFAGQVEKQLEPPPGRAPRGPDQYLLTDKLSRVSKIPIPTCDEVIARSLNGVA